MSEIKREKQKQKAEARRSKSESKKQKAKSKKQKQSKPDPSESLKARRKLIDGTEGKGRRPRNTPLNVIEREGLRLSFSIYGTIKAVAERLGYTTKHIHHLIKSNDMYDEIRECKGKLSEMVFEAAARYALFGYSVESEKIMVLHNQPLKDEAGNTIGFGDQIVRVPYIKHYPPSEKMLGTLLKHFHGISDNPNSDNEVEGEELTETDYKDYSDQKALNAPKDQKADE